VIGHEHPGERGGVAELVGAAQVGDGQAGEVEVVEEPCAAVGDGGE